jgi:single-stranded DNA-binding protein
VRWQAHLVRLAILPHHAARLCVEEIAQDRQTYKTGIPLECWVQAASTLGPLQEGTPLAISGTLQWKAWENAGKKEGSLVVSTLSVEVLAPGLAAEERSA